MMKKIFFYIAFILIASPVIFHAQFVRTDAMGGLNFSIEDEDIKFDPFQLGGNPAYLWQSRKTQRLEITQFNNGNYGQYRRKFSAERNLNVGANVLGVQPLGKNGTFQGRAYYIYDKRSNVYRTLKYDTYAGEAFYFTDTTSGDVVYNGPLFEFSHSLPLSRKINVGATVGYGLLNGLKKVYTYGETVYRNVYGTAGVTYAITDGLTVGADFSLFDLQERITASDVNLFTVITYHYRGDEHRIKLSGSKQHYKVAKTGNSFGGELFIKPDDKTEIGIVGKYLLSNTKSVFPVQGLELTDGYSQFENYSYEIRLRHYLTNNVIIAAVGNYYDNFSWSKNAKSDLLLWTWEHREIGAGIGVSESSSSLTFALEYRINSSFSDSTKFIDNRTNEIYSVNHDFRLGAEIRVAKKYFIRCGFSLLTMQHDFLFGGNNVMYEKFTAGFGFNLFDSFGIDLGGFYGTRQVTSLRSREFWDARITFRFNKF